MWGQSLVSGEGPRMREYATPVPGRKRQRSKTGTIYFRSPGLVPL